MQPLYLAFAGVCCAGSMACFGQPAFSITDLGSLGGDFTVPTAINSLGQIVGASTTAGPFGARHAFLYQNGQMIDIHPPTAQGESGAYSINSQGQVVGSWFDANPHAFIYSAGQFTSATRSDFAGEALRSINDSSQASGIAYTAAGGQPVLYNNGAFQFVGPSPLGMAADVNNMGHAAGYTTDASGGTTHAFLFDGTSSHLIGGTNSSSVAYALNDHDQVVGAAEVEVSPPQGAGSTQHAFLYDNGQSQDLGTLGGVFSFAQDINNRGQIVGGAQNSAQAEHAFLYENGVMFDLNFLLVQPDNVELTYAYGINDAGQIVAQGQVGGKTHGFLLNPIPEPGTGALAAVCLGGYLLSRIYRRNSGTDLRKKTQRMSCAVGSQRTVRCCR